jgi:HEPN domain-containing protein
MMLPGKAACSMKWNEQAEILRRRAADDEFTLRKLADDPQSPDWVIGFHARQAVEKLFKMVLNLHHVRYNRTHKLFALIAALEAAKIVIPDEIREAEILSP